MNNSLPLNLYSFIWHFLQHYKIVVVIYICLAVGAGCWGPINSTLLKHMVNTLSSSGMDNIALLTTPAILLVISFIIFDNFTWRGLGYLNYRFQPEIKNKIVSESFNYVLRASNQFFHNNLSGTISRQIGILADNVERILYPIASQFIRALSLILLSLITMWGINQVFFYILLTWFFAFMSFSIVMSMKIVILSEIHASSESSISGELVDAITNISNVKLFAKQSYEAERLEKSLLVTKHAFQKKELFIVTLQFVQGMLIATMLAFMIYFVIHLYEIHAVTIGDFTFILGLSMEVAYITWFTTSQVEEFYIAVGKCKQSLSKLIVQQDIKDKEDAQSLVMTNGKIVFEKVRFHYNGAEPLFQNKSVTIEAGQKVGLVGYSGSGKSTFVNLILRLYDVNEGRILIDDQDIRNVTQSSLHGNIALIPQDPTLFHRSLMENIRYGKTDATDKEVMMAAKKAHAHEFIDKLAEGYESPVGERGVKLSGGQRQRIAIARAILKNAPLLVLDEATSQLDSVTESDIQESLWELMEDKTTIVVAHRLSTLLHMDRILVFDHGKIVEDGTHTELLKKKGLYKTLWDAQVGGFLPEGEE